MHPERVPRSCPNHPVNVRGKMQNSINDEDFSVEKFLELLLL